jgi:predicted RNA binding protein YcfA (HicA-like mRNA interferase family)
MEHLKSPWHLGSSTTCCGRGGCVPSGRRPRRTILSATTQMKETRRELERQGFTATKTRGGHWRFEHPDMDGPVYAPDTPSDHRAIKNLQAMLRRKMRLPKAS